MAPLMLVEFRLGELRINPCLIDGRLQLKIFLHACRIGPGIKGLNGRGVLALQPIPLAE
jgi:hypothetical protein